MGFFALLFHFLTVSAASAQTWLNCYIYFCKQQHKNVVRNLKLRNNWWRQPKIHAIISAKRTL